MAHRNIWKNIEEIIGKDNNIVDEPRTKQHRCFVSIDKLAEQSHDNAIKTHISNNNRCSNKFLISTIFDICGKVALVSGGASGIGLATAKLRLENGAKGVTIVDINEENGKNVERELKDIYGSGRVQFLKVNVANRHEFEGVFTATIEAFKNLDIVINSAGIIKNLKWEEEIAINLGGTVSSTYFAFEKYMPKYMSGREGVVVNVASITAVSMVPALPVYCATKCGVVMFTRCYGTEVHYSRNPIRVMAVCPGYTKTAIHGASTDKLLNPAMATTHSSKQKAVIQSADHVANAIIDIIKEGPNGSVWVVENSEPAYKVKHMSKDECRVHDNN